MKKLVTIFLFLLFIFGVDIAYAGNTKDSDILSIDESNDFKQVVESLIIQKEYSKACFLAYELTKRHPQIPEGYFLLAKSRYKSGYYKAAIDAYTDCIRVSPKYYQAYFNRGVVYDQQKEYVLAIKDYTYIIRYDKMAAPYAYLNRGKDEYRLGKFKRAVCDYNKILKIFPSFDLLPEVYYNRGMARYALGYIKESVQDYEKAKALNPNSNYVYYDMLK